MEMQSQQRLFSVKRQAPQRRQLSTVGGRGRGRGRGSTPYFDPRFTDEEPYTFQATEKISLGDVELFNLQGCGVEYRVPEGHTPNKTQKIILDNLWYSVKQKDLAHFKAAMEALSSYFMQEASSSSATCQNCKTYRGQIAEVIDQIDNKDDKIQSLHERIMELEAQVDTLKSAPQAMQPQQQQWQQNLMQQQKPLLQVQEEVDRSKQIEISVLKIEQQTMELLQRVKFLPYMQDQVLRQYLHRRYDLSDLRLKSMRTILELPDDDLPPRDKDQDEEEKDEAQDEVRPIFKQGNFNLSKEDSPLHNNSRRPFHRSQLPPKRTGSPKFVQDKRKKLEDKAPATAM